MKKIAIRLFALWLPLLNAVADEARFQQANKEFSAGNFKAAISDYESEVRSGEWSANLFYDLGNACYRNGDFGQAILNYERALRIEPHHPEAAANLRVARDQARALELARSPVERFANTAGTTTYAVLAAISFWLALILLIVRHRRATLAAALLTLSLSTAAIAACYYLETSARQTAVVIGNNVEARVATADSARSVLFLPPGSEVRVLQERGDWNYAALPNDLQGWIPARAAERVRL